MFEEQLSQEIISFIEGEGYTPLVQIQHFMGSIDFVGIKVSECIIVESKISKWQNALKQAVRYGYGAEKTYVALPPPTARYVASSFKARFEKYGIGLIEVAEDGTTILIQCQTKLPSAVFKQVILSEAHYRLRKSQERVAEFIGRSIK